MQVRSYSSALRVAAAMVLGAIVTPAPARSAEPIRLAGSLTGSVQDGGGVPQMGAVVHIFNRQEKMIEKTLTDASGSFAFASLVPDVYSIRVAMASFVPAIRRNILVQPGMQSVLAVNLTSVLSSIDLVYSSRRPGTLMSDDWKWVLRSSMTTRPVMRILPGIDISDPAQTDSARSAMFSGTRGLVKLSAGETQSPFMTSGGQPDLGTTFALATSVFGQNQLQFSGNFGYGLDSATPTSGFRTSFSRADTAGPELKLTMHQVGIPVRGTGLGSLQNAPSLRTMSVTVLEHLQIFDGLELDYGASLESVAFLDRLNYISPFARLTYEVGPGSLDLGYSSGAPPVDLLNARNTDGSLQGDIAAVSLLPRVSVRDGRAQVQRSENMEIGYHVKRGSRTYSAGAYHENVRNGALTMNTPGEPLFTADLLPELSSRSSVFNIGRYNRTGYVVSAEQMVGDNFNVTVAAGSGGALTTTGDMLASARPDALRSMVTRVQRHWVRGMVSGVAPVMGTRYMASYEWSDARALTPGYVSLTQKVYPAPGLNIRLRQPVPGWNGLPGRMEITAELRNLLAQGYLPINTPDGRRMILASFPRAIRGGLAFIF